MAANDLLLQKPPLLTKGWLLQLSTDAQPTLGPDGGALEVGQELLYEDTGQSLYWDGSAWQTTNFPQQLNQLRQVALEIRDLLATLMEG